VLHCSAAPYGGAPSHRSLKSPGGNMVDAETLAIPITFRIRDGNTALPAKPEKEAERDGVVQKSRGEPSSDRSPPDDNFSPTAR